MKAKETDTRELLNSRRSAEQDLVVRFVSKENLQNIQTLAPGTKLVDYNQLVTAVWFISEGSAKVSMPNGTVVRVNAPTIFGEVAFLTGAKAMAEVELLTEAVVVKIPCEELRSWAAHDSMQSMWLYENLTKIASQRLSGNYHHRYCALVAHDGRKQELISFVDAHKEFFASQQLISTATTGHRIEAELGLQVARTVLSGPKGGDQEIGGLISRGAVDSLFFFRDPLWAQPHQADVNALVRISEVANVPIATNVSTAHFLVEGLIRAARL